MVVDLSDVTFIDATGMSRIVDAGRRHRVVLRGASARAAMVLEVTGMGATLSTVEAPGGAASLVRASLDGVRLHSPATTHTLRCGGAPAPQIIGRFGAHLTLPRAPRATRRPPEARRPVTFRCTTNAMYAALVAEFTDWAAARIPMGRCTDGFEVTVQLELCEGIVDLLGLVEPAIVVRGFDRPNIELRVQRHVDAADRDATVVAAASELLGPGIVYVGTQRRSVELCEAIAAHRPAVHYHGGLKRSVRDEAQRAFVGGEVDVIVATNAFGMGIDKPDVRWVLHADLPDSIDAYSQEVGRAGRDGEPAVAVLHYRTEDVGRRRALMRAAAGDPARAALVRSRLEMMRFTRSRRTAVERSCSGTSVSRSIRRATRATTALRDGRSARVRRTTRRARRAHTRWVRACATWNGVQAW